jgi:hypothetical protein
MTSPPPPHPGPLPPCRALPQKRFGSVEAFFNRDLASSYSFKDVCLSAIDISLCSYLAQSESISVPQYCKTSSQGSISAEFTLSQLRLFSVEASLGTCQPRQSRVNQVGRPEPDNDALGWVRRLKRQTRLLKLNYMTRKLKPYIFHMNKEQFYSYK